MSAPTKTTRAGKKIIPRYRVYRGTEIVLGPGKAELLEHIAATGSISEAARLMDMSYNRAWLHVKMMNENFKDPLVNSSRGGSAGGGAELTDAGKAILELYRQLEMQAAESTSRTRESLARLLKP